MFFGQSFATHDLAVIGLLIVLEGVLSIDNALVLGLLARRLPHDRQKKALTYGLIGAFVFRVIAIATVSLLLRWWWIKLLGGGYLLYVAVKHFAVDARKPAEVAEAAHAVGAKDATDEAREKALGGKTPIFGLLGQLRGFWATVVVIELTDIAFAVDSILAAMAMIPAVEPDKTNPKLWVVITGGMIGVILMRFAAVMFIRLLERFPRLETSAYLLIFVIGAKLALDWWFNKPPAVTTPGWHAPVDFHSPASAAFWVFWVLMVVCFTAGFMGNGKSVKVAA